MMNKTDKIPILIELLFYCEIQPVDELPHSVLRTEIRKNRTLVETLNLIPNKVDVAINDSRHLQGKGGERNQEKERPWVEILW